jgi:serine/threonine-protein kinase RsbT
MVVEEKIRSVRLYVGTEPDVAEAMRQTRRLSETIGFSHVQVCYMATVATELASNLWIHAGGGVFEASALEEGRGIEILTVDHGPGIADIALAMQEGYSTVGGLGCGLPGAERLMDELQIESHPDSGTRVCARKWK